MFFSQNNNSNKKKIHKGKHDVQVNNVMDTSLKLTALALRKIHCALYLHTKMSFSKL